MCLNRRSGWKTAQSVPMRSGSRVSRLRLWLADRIRSVIAERFVSLPCDSLAGSNRPHGSSAAIEVVVRRLLDRGSLGIGTTTKTVAGGTIEGQGSPSEESPRAACPGRLSAFQGYFMAEGTFDRLRGRPHLRSRAREARRSASSAASRKPRRASRTIEPVERSLALPRASRRVRVLGSRFSVNFE